MKRSQMLSLIVLAALVAAGGWYVVERRGETTLLGRVLDMANKGGLTSIDGSKLQGNATQQNPLEEVAGLAIKGINLFQGNKGLELWRLKASWAHMSQNGETIDVDKPVVRYALGEGSAGNPDDDVLDVKAEQGRITDNQRFLTLWDDVVISRFDDTITAPRMNYDANKRLMTFPEGAALESPTASGTAKLFTWDLANNEMHGSEGVLVILKPRPETPPKDAPAQEAAEPRPTPAQE